MKEREQIDISGYSYEEFVAFIFDRVIRADTGKYHPWYFDVEVAFDPNRLCEFYIRLFRTQDFAHAKYSKAQLESGFWAIHGSAFDGSVQHLMWNVEVPFQARSECVKSMFDLFERFFAAEPLETSVSMWWDSLCYAWECGNRVRQRGGEDALMQDTVFAVLTDLLQSDSEVCQGAALHGLGHLHHPSTQELVETYIRQRPSIGEEWKKYALASARFEIL